MTDETKFMKQLDEVHDFPCDFVFKAIGENSPEFVSKCVQGTLNILGSSDIDVKTRESSKGNHVSVTLTVCVVSAKLVVDVFNLLNEIEGVKYVL